MILPKAWSGRSIGIAALLVALVLPLVWLTLEPVRSATEIGGDEHYEVAKASLVARGFPLYHPIWNDQTPLHTLLLALMFRCFGATIEVARSVAVFFALLLYTALFLLVKARLGFLPAILAAVCLLVAPALFELSVSVMLELPAIAVALWSLWPIDKWAGQRHGAWLVSSGLLLAIALQMKLTALVFAPALAFEVFLVSLRSDRPGRIPSALLNVALWSLAVFFFFLVIGYMSGTSYQQLLTSHFSAATTLSAGAQRHVLSLSSILSHTEGFWGALLGLCVLALRRQWRDLAFPVVLLATALGVHLLHRPWWYYYYIHIAVPFAWITAYGVAELYKAASLPHPALRRHRMADFLGLICSSSVCVLVVIYGGSRLAEQVQRIRKLPRVRNSELVAKMARYAPATKWVYTRSTIYPFHAGLLVIPELAVLPGKRFWSGQVSEQQIWETVEKYRPEQLLLSNVTETGAKGPNKAFLEANYVAICDAEAHTLYISKRISTIK